MPAYLGPPVERFRIKKNGSSKGASFEALFALLIPARGAQSSVVSLKYSLLSNSQEITPFSHTTAHTCHAELHPPARWWFCHPKKVNYFRYTSIPQHTIYMYVYCMYTYIYVYSNLWNKHLEAVSLSSHHSRLSHSCISVVRHGQPFSLKRCSKT